MILAQREMLAAAQSEAKVRALEIERLKLQLAKARRETYGQSSERGKLLVEQLELAIEDLEETQAEEETKAEISAPESAKVPRRRAPRGPRKLPDNLPVERIVEPAPCVCGGAAARGCASSARSCPRRSNASRGAGRSSSGCARSSPAGTARRHRAAGAVASDPARLRRPEPARHDPGRQVRRPFAAEPPERRLRPRRRRTRLLDARRLGRRMRRRPRSDPRRASPARARRRAPACRRHDRAGARQDQDRTGRLWVYLRDDRPFGGQGPPAALFEYSPTRHGEYPRKVLAAWSGVMQADAFSGYNALYAADRKPEPVVEARVGRMGGATSSTSPNSPRRRSRPRSCAASTNCLPSSAPSTASRPRYGARSGRNDRSRSSPRSRPIWPSSSSGCHRRTTSPRRSATC